MRKYQIWWTDTMIGEQPFCDSHKRWPTFLDAFCWGITEVCKNFSFCSARTASLLQKVRDNHHLWRWRDWNLLIVALLFYRRDFMTMSVRAPIHTSNQASNQELHAMKPLLWISSYWTLQLWRWGPPNTLSREREVCQSPDPLQPPVYRTSAYV